MTNPWLHQLGAWHNFYLLLGTAAATLTGLMFIVVSLGPRLIATHTATGVRAFVTPTVMYFTTVLVVAALMTIPALPRPCTRGLAVMYRRRLVESGEVIVSWPTNRYGIRSHARILD
jgi:hypothetical protein